VSAETVARYPASGLREWTAAVLVDCGLTPDDARTGAEILVDADLAGIGTHGLSNLAGHHHYLPGLESGAVAARPEITVLRESPATAAWEAGRGFGPVVAHRAMTAALDKAEAAGVGMLTVRDGCHSGALGHYARLAARRGMIGLVAAHTSPAAAPPGGTAAAIGTNPLAVGAPVAGGAPFVFDMAVTAAAGTKVLVARRDGVPVPPGWILDAAGNGTTDPQDYASLALLGAGPAGGGHKGFGLGVAVDVLSGMLSGTGSGLFQRYEPEWRIGGWYAALRIDAFVDPAEFDREMARMVESLHAMDPAPGTDGVHLPGERAERRRAEGEARGLSLAPAVVASCREAGERHGIPFPDPR